MVPTNSVPMSQTNCFPMDKWSLEHSDCPGGQAVGILKYKDQIDWGPFVLGDQILGIECDGDRLSRGINFMGIICLGRQEVGDRTCSHMATLYGCCRWRPEVHYCKHSEPLVPNCSAHKTSFYATRNSNGSILKVKTSSLLEFVIVHDFYDPSVILLFTHSGIYGTVALDVLPRAQSHHCTR